MTPKERAYCRARAEGKGPAAAFKASRDTSKMSSATIHSNAKRMERKPHIKAGIEQMRRELRNLRWAPITTRAHAREGQTGGTRDDLAHV